MNTIISFKRFAASLFLALTVMAHGSTTIDSAHRFAYGANIGWLNCRGDVSNGAVIGEYVCAGYIYSANVGWIHLGDGTPSNGIRYSNASGTDFGVNHDGIGNLTGLAYGANIGWISFPTNASGAKVDLVTGTLSGFVYSANCGWISLSNTVAFAQTDSIQPGTDSDLDGMADAWERIHFGDLKAADANSDYDGDGHSDVAEYQADTSPANPNDFLRILSNSVVFSGGLDTDTLNWTSRPTRQYRISYRNDLQTGTDWTDTGLIYAPAPGTNRVASVQFDLPSSQRYFRVEALRPLE